MLLLDTQVLLWAASGNPRLGSQSRTRIEESPQVYVSSATILELTIKSMLGKLRMPDDAPATIAQAGFLALPISHDDARGLEEFPELTRHDPFDRVLVSQAFRAGLTLITADTVLLRLRRDFIVDGTE